MSGLRDYQQNAVDDIRRLLYEEGKRSVVSQLPTGAGKTVIVSAIVKAISRNGKKTRTWFVVPRKELVAQTKKHYAERGINFGVIDAEHKESRAYDNHIVSLQTLVRRLEKIKEFPDICFFDECHINYDAQLKIMRYFECAACEKSFFENREDEFGHCYRVRVCGEQSEDCQKVKKCEVWRA
jgi:superfamily II DNA or RNA helicase